MMANINATFFIPVLSTKLPRREDKNKYQQISQTCSLDGQIFFILFFQYIFLSEIIIKYVLVLFSMSVCIIALF